MSDFDKEAERQKLREKFDRDREKRAETERMSQLLLQGATMTNRHCNSCGDPLFRYQDREFCATCEGRAQDEAQADAQTAQSPTDVQAESTRTTAQQDTTPAVADSQPGAGESANETVEQTTETPADDGGAQPATETTPPREHTVEPRRVDGDLHAAHESLVRTLSHHARRAEAVDDPRRATDHLAAVREAAEALSALERDR